MGRQFIEGTVPKVLFELRRLNDNLEAINNKLQKTEEDSAKDAEEK
jgi:hypothetical protein